MTIRLLHIIPSLDRGGAEKQMSLLATRLPRDRFDVHVCVLTRDGPLRESLAAHDIPVTVIGKTWKIDPAAYYRLKRFIHKLQPDLVHTWIFAANSYGRQAALAAGVKRIVAGERCVDPWKRWHELAIDRYLAKRTDRIITNSSAVTSFYQQHGIEADRFTVIPNGIDPIGPSSLTREALLAELDLPDDAKLVGAVGRLWLQKRVKDLIWASHLIDVARRDTHLLIVGDGPERWRLERYARQVDENNVVHFLGQRDDVPRLLPHLNCLWLASGYEGQSNAILEAMSCGVPVVASDIPGNRELVQHEQTGYLVPLGDKGAFARKTNTLFADDNLAQRLGAAGRLRIETEFTVEKMVERHVAVYEQLLGQQLQNSVTQADS